MIQSIIISKPPYVKIKTLQFYLTFDRSQGLPFSDPVSNNPFATTPDADTNNPFASDDNPFSGGETNPFAADPDDNNNPFGSDSEGQSPIQFVS